MKTFSETRTQLFFKTGLQNRRNLGNKDDNMAICQPIYRL